MGIVVGAFFLSFIVASAILFYFWKRKKKFGRSLKHVEMQQKRIVENPN